MFDRLYSLIKSEIPLYHFNKILLTTEDLVDHFDRDYFQDKNARDAAIDSVCQVLQEHKSKPLNQ